MKFEKKENERPKKKKSGHVGTCTSEEGHVRLEYFYPVVHVFYGFKYTVNRL